MTKSVACSIASALEPKDWWLMVKPHVRSIQREDGVITVDDSIVEKPYTDENEIICWHYDHAKGRTVKGINFITALYEVDDVSLPVTFRLVTKTEPYIDKDGKPKRRSAVTKNEHYRAMLQQCVQNQIPFRYVLNDIWFASAENMRFVKLDLEKEFIMALKANRKVALSAEDKQQGRYQRIDQLDLPEDTLNGHLSGAGALSPSSAPPGLHKRRRLDRCALSGDERLDPDG